MPAHRRGQQKQRRSETDLGCLELDPVARLTVGAEQERITDDLVSDLNDCVAMELFTKMMVRISLGVSLEGGWGFLVVRSVTSGKVWTLM